MFLVQITNEQYFYQMTTQPCGCIIDLVISWSGLLKPPPHWHWVWGPAEWSRGRGGLDPRPPGPQRTGPPGRLPSPLRGPPLPPRCLWAGVRVNPLPSWGRRALTALCRRWRAAEVPWRGAGGAPCSRRKRNFKQGRFFNVGPPPPPTHWG
jgi:hypothetical protein